MRIIFLFVISFFFFSCSNQEEKESTKIVKKEVKKTTPKKEIPIEVPVPYLIDNENVEEKLLAYGKENPETILDIYTTYGKLRVRLYEDTPLHRANFVMLAKKGFFKGSVFTRAVQHFIAQGGGTSKQEQVEVKKSIGSYTIPNEIKRNRIHKRGTLGAARSYLSNPDKRSDPYAFYFVEGMKYKKELLKHYEMQNNYTYNQFQIDYYTKNPGAAHIDGEHTVFGEIISGYSVVPKITVVETDSREWPRVDIFIDSVVVIK